MTHFRKPAFLILFFLLSALNGLRAEQYLFQRFTTLDGLSGNSVLCMSQDCLDIIWAGTRNGVSWFDGNRFNPLSIQDSEGFLDGAVHAICSSPDGRLWMSSGKGLCSYHPQTGAFQTVAIPDGNANYLICDGKGQLWFILNGEVNRMDTRTLETVRYPGQDYFYAYRNCLDDKGQVWFSSRDGQLLRYLPENDSFEPFRILSRQALADGISPRIIEPLSDGEFLIATSTNDILRVNPSRGTSETLARADDFEDEATIMCLLENRKGEYLIGSNKGLYMLENGARSVIEISGDSMDRLSLSSDNIRSLFKDRDGRVWIGTFYTGINLWLQSDIDYFRNFSSHSPYSIQGNTVRSICLDDADHVWIGTEDGFLNRINPDRTVLAIGAQHGLPQMANYHSLLFHDGLLVIASYDNGIFLFDPEKLSVRGHFELPDTRFICMLLTRDGALLVGAGNGLYYLDTGTGRFRKVEALGSLFVHALYEDRQGRIWVGTYGSGPWLYDRGGTGGCAPMASLPGGPSLEKLYITHLFEDRDGTVWMATEGNGLCLAREEAQNPGRFKTAQFTRTGNGLPSNVTCAIVQSREGLLWVSTDMGLFSFDPKERRLTGSYFDKNVTVGNFFRYGAVMMNPDGRIFMGATRGMLAFRPSSFQSSREPEILITEILAGREDKTQPVPEPGHSAMTSGKIRVKHRDAGFLTIRFANITEDSWHPQRFRYRLRHRKRVTESVTEGNSVTFAGIRPGHYQFEVAEDGSAAGAAGTQLSIQVIPPLYASWPAQTFYAAAFLLLGAWGLTSVNRRKKSERERQIRHLEEQKQHEIYDAKINFFTNIAHEIRTPLTLIKIPVDKLVKDHQYPGDIQEDLETVKANTDRLLNLTNQLLDFRKMESKQLRLNFLPEDFCGLVRRVCGYFSRAAEENHTRLAVSVPETEIRVMCAATSIEKVISNLISNGLKYCQSSVSVTLEESGDGQEAILRVSSDGERIAPAHREKIFEPFYQERSSQIKIIGSKGTGLGLPFARMLTELHGGRLFLDETALSGNVFVLRLPKKQDQPAEFSRPETAETGIPAAENEDRQAFNRHTILIAEDDTELNNYLKKALCADYNILQAFNGDEALAVIKTQKVDILVSDIMMPGLDGCSLCNIIKTHLEFSHIPVLLLTAAVGMERHIETLQVGADGYLEKPFPIDLLKANIRNLFDNRELTFKQFTNSPLSHFNGLKVGNMDDDYMNRLHKEVMARLSNPDLGIDDLVSAIGTSKSTLFRKVKANTGLNINEYIKLCRLKKAAELLAGQKYKIGEVVYMVGFSSASYFTANFKKQFNISPSDFIRQVRGERKSGTEET